ncbi:hypothetical protein OSB04_004011 [Centaurea solstitialis]|uniref:Uncharacterized protein n=1 Tax=Centaurea solstitialis TaxID=347529 RepID=A0AA38U7Q0_9ASTR|nr:hypothetical protein OSB04_004011 [Centaurea solstitialis]
MCGGGDHDGCKYQAAFNAIQTQKHLQTTSITNRDAEKTIETGKQRSEAYQRTREDREDTPLDSVGT